MPMVYILRDGAGHIYTGSTTDMERRLREHRRGHTATTRRLGAFTVVWSKEYMDLVQARKIEKKIKQWKSRKMLDLLIRGVIQI